MATSMPQLLSVPEVARALGISERMVWRLIREGRLKSLKIGASRRVDQRDLDACIDSLKAVSR